MISWPLRLQPVDDAGLGAGEAYGGKLRGDRHHHQVDVDIILVEEGEPRLPAFLLNQPSTWRAPSSWVRAPPQPISTQPSSMTLKSPPSKVPAVTMS